MKKKSNYLYLVFCNKEPILYSIFQFKKPALDYAKWLIEYRMPRCSGFYHRIELTDKEIRQAAKMDNNGVRIFSTCLKSVDEYDDGCLIKVERWTVFVSKKFIGEKEKI